MSLMLNVQTGCVHSGEVCVALRSTDGNLVIMCAVVHAGKEPMLIVDSLGTDHHFHACAVKPLSVENMY